MNDVLFVRWYDKYSGQPDAKKDAWREMLSEVKTSDSILEDAMRGKWNATKMIETLKSMNVDVSSLEEGEVPVGYKPLGMDNSRFFVNKPTFTVPPRTPVLGSTGTDRFPASNPRVRVIPLPGAQPDKDEKPVEVEMVSDPAKSEKKPGKAEKSSLGSRFKSWLPGGKKEKEPVAEDVEILVPNQNRSESPSKKGKSGSMITWAAVALLLLIVLVGIGAVFSNSSFGVVAPVRESNTIFESSDGSSSGSETVSEECALDDGSVGVKTYYVRPLQSADGLSTELKYVAIRSGVNFVLARDANTPIVLPVDKFATEFEVICSSTVSMQMLIDADKSGEITQLVYKFNLSHWSSWFVLIAAIATIGFALLSLTMTGNNFVDIIPFLAAIVISIAGVGITGYLSSIVSLPQVLTVLPAEALMKLALVVPAGYLVSYFGPVLWAVCSGSKSEIRQLNAQFESQGTLKVPDSVETVFLSLSRGKGLIGGFDWSMGAQVTTVLMVIGVLSYLFAPIYHLLGNRLWALFFEGALIATFYLLENIRRGSKRGIYTWWAGFAGLLDPIIIYAIVNLGVFGLDLEGSVIASLLGSVLVFVGVLVFNIYHQSKEERQELMRDMLGDNMAFYSAMKLVGIFAFILSQLM